MPTIQNVSDTARLAAMMRALEYERRDALFRDPFAKRLAGEEGEAMLQSLPFHQQHAWSWVTRTVLFNRIIESEIQAGTDLIVNLAAGLDARPYYMTLPGNLLWIEADLPGILDYKESVLAGETPRCRLERVRVDLSQEEPRQELFDSLAPRAERALIMTEGLLIYLARENVAALAQELGSHPNFARWALDLVSPGLLPMLQQGTHSQFSAEATKLQFAPPEGPGFIEQHGWKRISSPSMLHTAAKLRRLPGLRMKLFSLIPPGDPYRLGQRPWSSVCLFGNQKYVVTPEPVYEIKPALRPLAS